MELIVISDLHLSDGYNQLTGRYSRNEDFFFDEELTRFLKYFQRLNSFKRYFHLVIAGDLFDFLQVDPDLELLRKHPNLSKEADFEVTDSEEEFGLGTQQDKAVWKLKAIADGHEIFFQALADFLSKGNRLSIITGNHDIELYWRDVQTELTNQIAERRASKAEDIKGRISFHPWFYYDRSYRAYIEHGNQYDQLNSFQHLLHPLLEPESKELWLPFGSFFVRYFFNKVETVSPFADNMKPPTKYLAWAWKEHKLRFLRNWKYLLTMWRVFKKSKRLSRGDKEELQKENETRIQTEAGRFSLDEDAVLGVYALMTPPFTRNKLRTILYFAGTVCSILALILFVVLFVLNRTSNLSPWAFLSSLGLLVVPISKWVYSKFFQKDPFKIVLSRIKTHLKDVRIIVFGHTHDPDIRVVNNEYSYFNTGTWTTVFSEEERIIRESKQFSFVWIKEVDGEPSAELLRWSDCLKRPAKIMLFQQKS